jgi:hypothetical protein
MKKNMAILKAARMAAGLPALVLVFGLLVAGCSIPTSPISGDAATPVLSYQPTDVIYGNDDTIASPLFVIASVTDGGNLTYQWYSNEEDSASGGASLLNETHAVYMPPIPTTGTVYYYVVVTNTNDAVTGEKIKTATSRAAKVEKVDGTVIHAATPTITAQPLSATYNAGAPAAALSVTATITDAGSGGNLSYQWFSNTANSTEGGTLMSTQTTYMPSTASAGTTYYYVIVTNTNNNVNGTKTRTATSSVATITVNSVGGGGSSNPFVGTWTADDGGSTLTLTVTASDWEMEAEKGTYNRNGNTATFIATHQKDWFNGSGNWVDIVPPEIIATATVSGNTMNWIDEKGPLSFTKEADAAMPIITGHPQSAAYTAGTPAASLSVTANIADAGSGGNLTYQWYSNTANSTSGGTSISTQTTSTYTPSTASAGTFYYYVIVTNTNNSVNGAKMMAATSSVATITVNSSGSGGGSNPFVGTWTGSGVTLNVTAALEWDVEGSGLVKSKGTYMHTGNTATLTPTHYWTGTAWAAVPSGTPLSTATVLGDGNTMTGTYNSEPFTLTKNGVPPVPPGGTSEVDGTWISTNTVTTFGGVSSYFKIVTADGYFNQFIAPSQDAPTEQWQPVITGTYTGEESPITVTISKVNTIMFDGNDDWKLWAELGPAYQAYMGGSQTSTLTISDDQFVSNGLIFRKQ